MFIIFAILALAIVLLVHYYVGRRIYQGLRQWFPNFKKVLFWPIFWLVVCSIIIAYAIPTYFFTKPIAIIANYWLGIFFYTLLFLVILEIVRILSWVRIIPAKFLRSSQVRKMTALVILILVIGIVIYGRIHAGQIQLAKYDVKINKPAGELQSLKIVLVSDLHLGYEHGKKDVEEMVTRINTLEPDIVCIAGDLVDGNAEAVSDRAETAALFKDIKSEYGVYACLGNHDAGGTYAEMEQFFQDTGILFLDDEALTINNSFTLAGMKDSGPIGDQGEKRKTTASVLKNVDKSKPVILLDHRPSNLDEALQAGADLMLSGHTHHGQVFPGQLVTNMNFEVDYGYLKKDSLQTIVSSGIGTWGPPLRIGSDSEIVLIEVQFQ